jgi:hypothetical protein
LHGREHGETAGGDQGSRVRLTHSVPLFSCKQQEKNRKPGTTYRLRLSRKLQDDNRKWVRPAASGWARIAVDNRTKQDENRTKTGNGRNPRLHNGSSQGALAPSRRLRFCSSTIEVGSITPMQ